jgi:hypothetical protein
MRTVRLEYTTRPRLLPIYARGLVGGHRGLKFDPALPEMHAEWKGFKIDRRRFKHFMDICGLPASDTMPMVYPLVFAFPLHMTMVGHRDFPLPYVRMMQIRNHVIQHRPIGIEESLDISSAIVAQRVVAKGLEMDVHTGLEADGDQVWESVHTYFFPGKFGQPDLNSPLAQLSPLAADNVEETWTMPNGGGFCLGLMAGDYNPVHYLAPYARRMGFNRPFAHAQLSVALCVHHLPPFSQDESVRLDVAIKGPVYYGSNVTMKRSDDGASHRFDLYCEDNPRPCISGSLSYGSLDSDLECDNPYFLLGCA